MTKFQKGDKVKLKKAKDGYFIMCQLEKREGKCKECVIPERIFEIYDVKNNMIFVDYPLCDTTITDDHPKMLTWRSCGMFELARDWAEI